MRNKVIGILVVCILIACVLTACSDGNTVLGPTKLATPAVTIAGNVVSWDAVADADGYVVDVNGKEVSVAETSYTVLLDAPGSVQIKVKAFSENKSVFSDSDYSAPVTYALEVVKLAAPIPQVNGTQISWEPVENAFIYQVEFDGEISTQTQTVYDFSDAAVGEHTFVVKAVAGSAFYADSEPSQLITVTIDPVKLSTPYVQVNDYVVSWSAVDNAVSYEIKFDDETFTQTETSYDFSDASVGTHTFSVKAVAGSDDFVDSEYCAPITVTITPVKLSTPVVVADENVFSWDAVENAASYEVFVDGVSVGIQTELNYVLNATEYKVYRISVKAIAGSDRFSDSDISSEAVYEKVKPTLSVPVLSVDGSTVSWEANPDAASYKVYADGVVIATVEETSYTFTEPGTYSVQVSAIASDPDSYADSGLSDAVKVTVLAPIDFDKPFYVYSPHLAERVGQKYVLGIADETNYSTLPEAYRNTLDTSIDNYLCNLPTSPNWTDEQYGDYAWMLEEVTDYTGTIGVIDGVKIYRIRLTDGTYLSVAKNNHIGTGGDYLTSSEYYENDIWQYWQFVKIQDGDINDYYIYNVGHNYDWYAIRGNAVTDALTDTNRSDGGAELYPMDSNNKEWFVYTLVNVDGAQFEEVKHTDYSGEVVFHNLQTKKLYGFEEGDVNLKQITDYSADAVTDDFVWTLERVDYNGMSNVYRIKLADGSYLAYGEGYRFKATSLIEDTSTAEGQCQLFVLNQVHGVKNGFYIGHIFDGTFVDGNDGQTRYYCLDGGSDIDAYVSRQWGSIDWKNHMSNIWIIDAA